MREMFKDSKGNLSSMRVMSMIALFGGLGALYIQLLSESACALDLELVYVALFGGALGGKAAQAKFEKG